MPFGLTNAPATFQSLMNEVFDNQIRDFVLVFFDDILVYSPSLEKHISHLRTVLELLSSHTLYVKKSKCEFAKSGVEYLGHRISQHGVEADKEKIRAMIDWPVQQTLKALRGFLGLTGYYRWFVAHYGLISRPLTQLLKKGVFKWCPEAESTFNKLKSAMASTPVLAMPDFSKKFILEIDACHSGVGDVLMQEGKPIAFLSKVFANRHLSLSTYEKELMAVIMAMQK
ncbi:putative mitochondrial protein AtMg00860 [Apium graveolens]|uniref:putative mitochondrial protein AtMg00860 n=1 Tax=Apium graveolens TaxID=4045 RepID=UPI003D7BF407